VQQKVFIRSLFLMKKPEFQSVYLSFNHWFPVFGATLRIVSFQIGKRNRCLCGKRKRPGADLAMLCE